ncbi:MAG TPA: hypothetical protein VGK00_03920 [Anaerolineales bacterium]
MPPTSLRELFLKALSLVFNAIGSVGGLIGFMFNSFLRVSPLPDEVDFFIFLILLIWLIVLIIRLFRGKSA